MTNIWCIGKRYEYLVTNTTVASSIDGVTWNNFSTPFDIKEAGSSILYHNNSLVAFSYNGNISYSNNLATWIKGNIGVDGFAITGSVSTNKAIACGRRHYLSDFDGYAETSEIAQIFDSITGEPDTWAMIFTSAYNPSGFYSIRYFPSCDIGNHVSVPMVVVVGDKGGMPYALYSTDLGETFTEISVSSELTHPFYDVAYNTSTKKWYFATVSYIAETPNLLNPSWTTSEVLDVDEPITQLKLNADGAMCAITKKSVWYSANLTVWQKFAQNGYQWRSIEYLEEDRRWVAGAESLLTQNTFWTSSDGINWLANNNTIHMMKLITVS